MEALRTENERCLPEKSGLAADVDRILQGYSARPEPKRYEVPIEPGVYRGVNDKQDLRMQLDETGQWWPYPYSFSGWRVSEMSLFELTLLPELELDVPEIRNPHLREAVAALTEDLLTAFPEIGDVERARKFALERLQDQF